MTIPVDANTYTVFLLFLVLGLLFQVYASLSGYRTIIDSMQRDLKGEGFRVRIRRQFEQQEELPSRLRAYRTTLSVEQRKTIRLLLIGAWLWGALIVIVLVASPVSFAGWSALIGFFMGTVPIQLIFESGRRHGATGGHDVQPSDGPGA